MKKYILALSIPVFFGLTFFTCASKEENKEQLSAPTLDESAVAVRLSPVKEGAYALPIVSSGIISTGTESKLSFKIGGIVSKIFVDEGQSVTKGQVLALLDLTEIDGQVNQAKNNLEKTKRDLERAERLYRDSAATREQVQNAQTTYDVATENYRIATFNKHYASIRATTSGKVIRKLINEGELVAPGNPVLFINAASENDWIIRVGLPDVDWVRVRPGDKARLRTDAYADETLDAEVTLISEGAEPLSGLYPVELRINPNGKKLATGLVASVEIIPSAKNTLKSIPIEAVVEGSGNEAFVFIAMENKINVKKIPVRIAYLTNSEAMVSHGLNDVQEVITAGSAFLTESTAIKVVQ